MNFNLPVSVFAAFLSLGISAIAWAGPKTYQVTGPVLEMDASKVVVQKGNEKWEVSRDPSTTISGDLKVGSKVTVEYRMIANSIQVKAEKTPAKKSK